MLPEAEAARYFAHVLGALRHAHGRGFLHCDVKPANVRLDRGCERAVLVDWGMARRRDHQSGGSISQGTPAYASPEQLTGYNPSSMVGYRLCERADVWSLGATLVEMLTGTPPFGGQSFEALVTGRLVPPCMAPCNGPCRAAVQCRCAWHRAVHRAWDRGTPQLEYVLENCLALRPYTARAPSGGERPRPRLLSG